MAKKEIFKTSNDSFDLDKFLNDADMSGDINLSANKNGKKEQFKSFGKGVISGIKDSFKSPAFLAKAIGSVIPTEYGSSTNSSKDIYRQVSSLYNDAVREIKPGFQQIARQVDKLVPQEQKTLKSYTAKLKAITGADDNLNNSSFNAEEAKTQSINTALGQIFALQAEQEVNNRVRDKAEDTIKQQVDLKRFNMSAMLLGSINSNITRLTAYNDKINQAYQKKSLELQYRSLYVQTDLLATTRSLYQTIAQQNNELIKLSSMSDQDKITNSESFKKKKSGKYIKAYASSLLGRSEYVDSVKKRLTRAKNDKVESIKAAIEKGLFGLDAAESGIEAMKMGSDVGLNSGEMAGGLASNFGLEYLITSILSKYRKKIIKPGGKIDNVLGTGASRVRDLPTLISSIMNSKHLKASNKIEDYGSLKEKGKGFLRSLLDPFMAKKPDMSIDNKRMKIGDLNNPAIFDNKTHKSITTIIPGFLARIYRELQIIRTGDNKIQLSEFSYSRDKFTSRSNVAKDIAADLNKKILQNGHAGYVSSAVNEITKGLELSPEALKAISDRTSASAYDPTLPKNEKLYVDRKWLASLPSSVKKDVFKFIKSKYGKNADNLGANKNLASEQISRVSETGADVRGNIEEYVNSGYATHLKKAGFIKDNKYGDYDIDSEKVADISRLDTAKFKKDYGDPLVNKLVKAGDAKRLIDFGVLYLSKETNTYEINVPKLEQYKDEHPGSDKYIKARIAALNPANILEGIKKSKVHKWIYKDGRDKFTEHIGPMAQDVKKNLGEKFAPGGKHLDMVNLNGAALSAISHIDDKLQSLKSEIEHLYKSPEARADIGAKIGATTSRYFSKANEAYKKAKESVGDKTSGLKKKIEGDYSTYTIPDILKAVGGSIVSGISRFVGGTADKMINDWFPKAKHIYGKFIKPYLDKGAETNANNISNIVNPITDVYVKGDKEPRLLASKIKDGDYIDKTTGDAIKSLRNIHGVVVDKAGNEVLTVADFRKGLVDSKGKPLKTLLGGIIDKSINALSFGIVGAIKGYVGAFKLYGKTVRRLVNPIHDIYVPGEDEPRMFAKGIKDGSYVDVHKKKRIKGQDDIYGPVIDKNGNVVLTRAEVQAGLVDIRGRPIRTTRGMVMHRVGQISKLSIKGLLGVPKVGFKLLGATIGKLFSGKKDDLPELNKYQGVIAAEQLKTLNTISQTLKANSKKESGIMGPILPTSGPEFTGPIKPEGDSSVPEAESAEPEGKPGKSEGLSGFAKAGSSMAGKAGDKLTNLKNTKFNKIPGLGKLGGFLGGKLSTVASLFGGSDNTEEDKPKEDKEVEKTEEVKAAEDKSDKRFSKGKNIYRAVVGADRASTLASLDKLQKGNNMSVVNREELENATKRKELESNKAVADTNPQYASKNSLFGGMLGKIKAFKGLLGKAFGMLGDIPGIGKVGKMLGKIPFLGKLFGGASEVAGVAEGAAGVAGAAEGAAGVAGAAEGVAAVTGGATVAGAIGSSVLAVGGAMLGGVMAVLTSPVTLVVGGVALAAYGSYKLYKYMSSHNNTIKLVDTYRFAQYGLTPADKEDYHYVKNLEAYLIDKALGFNGDTPYLIDKNINVKDVLTLFNIDIKSSIQIKAFLTWYGTRFKPVFLSNVASLFRVDNKAKLNKVSSLSKADQLKFINLAKFPNGPYNISVSPFSNITALKADGTYVAKVFDIVNSKLKEGVTESKETLSDKLSSMYSKVKNGSVAAFKAATGVATTIGAGAKIAYNTTKSDIHTAGKAIASAGKTAGKAIGDKASQLYKATEGVIAGAKNISLASVSKTAVKTMVGSVATMFGINPALLETIAAIESSFNPNARAGTSSAAGLFQFIDSTWDGLVAKYGAKFGITKNTPRTDPKANAIMGAIYLKNNLDYIKSVKPNPNVTDAYLTHFLGPGGAKQILSAPKDTIAAQILPSAAKANVSLFYKNGQALSVGDFYSHLSTHLSKIGSEYGIDVPVGSIDNKVNTKATASKTTPIVAAGKANAPIASGKATTAVATSKTAQIGNIDKPNAVLASIKKPLISKPINMPGSVQTPIVTPSNAIKANTTNATVAATTYTSKPSVAVETGQGFHMQKVHEGLGDVSDLLTKSLSVQTQMLAGIHALSNNKTASKPNVTSKAAQVNKPTQASSPAVNLARTVM